MGGRPVRQPSVAGTFYPATEYKLRELLSELFQRSPEPKLEGRVRGVVSPHAGYIYSGEVAAVSYKAIKKEKFKTVILLGPTHTVYFRGASIFSSGYWQTPLGEVGVDEELAHKILNASKLFLDEPEFHIDEHSIEVQVPFLQYIKSDVLIVPIMIGDLKLDELEEVAQAIAETLDEEHIIIASSDLYHGYSYDECVETDRNTLELIENFDYRVFYEALKRGSAQACGGLPIAVLMRVMQVKGVNEAKVLHYTNSARVTGIYSGYVVGYGSVAFIKKKESSHNPLSEEEKKELLNIARDAIERAVKGLPLKEPEVRSERLKERRGVFVTIKEGEKLRGCIGYITGIKPLHIATRDAAVSAALEDPRFPPVTVDELPYLTVEVSVLTPLRRVKSLEEIEVGRHGILIRRGFYQGLLLPQVATENNWDRDTFLMHTCLKAGLEPDCFKDPETEVYVFEAEIFDEREFMKEKSV